MIKNYLKKISAVTLFLTCSQLAFSQIIYQHNFGTSTFTAVNPYGVAPTTIDPNLSASQWATSVGAGYTTFAGSTGQALSIANSSATPTYSLSFTVAPGYTCSISDFSFWRQRSGTGAPNWTLSVNGSTVIGAGTTPTVGVNTGTLAVSSPVNNLSGTVNVILQLSGASGTGSFRLDDFTLYGIVSPTITCTPPTTQATTFSVTAVGTTSATINWTSGTGGNAIVLAHASSAVNASPSSGNSYAANSVFPLGQQIGTSNYVVYNSTGSSVTVTGLSSGVTYYFSVFQYNTTSGFPCYLTPGLTGSVTTVGGGSCTTPSVQASSFNATAIGTTSATINWTAGSGGHAVVIARSTTSVTSAPISLTSYAPASTIYGNGGEVAAGTANYLVYDGTGTSVTVTNLNPGTAYYFEVFEYNITGLDTCYMTPGLSGSITALAAPVPTTCLQIKNILVNACDGAIESYNEMVYFKNGSNPLPITQLSIAGAPKSGVYAIGKWPNNSNIWNGAVMNATTSANVSTINGSITKCGRVLEPPVIAGIGTIPANAYCILVGSQVMSPLANSFANLTDTIYMIFQTASTTTAGNFVNWSGNNIGTRGLVLIDNANACTSNTVTYEPQLLLSHADGDGAAYNSNNTVSYYNNGCQAPYTALAVDAGPNQTSCNLSLVTLTATPSGVYNSVTWSGGTGVFSSPSTLSTTYTLGVAETGTIKLYCSITRSCASSTVTVKDSVYITNFQLPSSPVISATNGYSLCPLASTILSYSISNATATGTMSATWSSPAASTSTYAVSAPSGTVPVTYTLSLTNFCGVTTKTVNVYPLASPSVTISAPTLTACAGNTVAVMATSNSGNFSWSNPAGAITSSVVLTANTTTTGVVTTTNTCGSKTDTYTLTVTQNPTISVDNANVSLCSGQSATVTATSSLGTYTWTPGPVNTNSIVVNAAGTHTVATSNVCNTASATVNVVVSAAATLTISSTANLVCVGGQVTSTLSLSGSTGSYTWSNGTNANTTTITTPGVYTATVNTGFCGLANASFTVGVLPTPTISVVASSTLLCNGATATLTASSNVSNYVWSTSATTNTISVNTTGTYTVGVSNACGSPTATITILADATPTLNLVSSTNTLCASQSATLTVTGGSAGPYTWSNSASTGSVVTTTGGTVSVSYTNVCGSDTKSVSITMIPTPTISVASTSALLCNGATATLTASSNMSNYVWSTSATTNTISVTAAGTYTVGVSNACGTQTTSINIQMGVIPTLTLTTTSNVLCPNQTATLTVTGGAQPYVWSNSASTGSVVAVSAGNYTVSSTNACGTGSQTITINTSTVTAGLDGTPLTGTQPLIVSFTNLSTGATTYTWNYGNGTTTNASTPVSQTYTAAGTYTVLLSVTNANGCTNSQSILITVTNEPAVLVIPNVFTPNGDNVNDVFYVKATNLKDFNCVIFDRWGLQLYSWSDVKGGWDGKTGGKDVTDGTYFYIINAIDIDNKDVKRQGTVTLLR